MIRRTHVVAELAALTMVGCSLAGCTGKGPSAPPSASPAASTPSPSPTVDPSVAQAVQSATAAYRGYIQYWAIASQAADPNNPDLARYVADPLLSLTLHNIRRLRDNGQVQLGAQTATIVSTQADLDAAQPTVTIHACLDYSALKLVYKSNSSPVPNSAIKNPKLSTIATVWRYQTGQWLVNKIDDGTDPC
ncbi:hypothetical protein AB0M46_00405 [Dactylosporangium sp. NPDC051485]|uniref:hypothetical protein n=1 Tax=Dactylosporangium sp. NPDC051485 TaxID=3154846 RepID=UPI00344ABF86